MYEILNAASFIVGNLLRRKSQKNSYHSLVNFKGKSELDLILGKKEEARRLDVDHFYDMIRTAQDDQILKVLKSFIVREIS